MKGKSFVAGLLIGLATATTVSALGAGSIVNAWLPMEPIGISVDGRPLEIPNDTPVLEYQGKYYADTRLITENLGAEMTFIDSRNTINIKSPEPIREYIEVEKIVEKEAPEVFYKVPVRQIIEKVTINILGISRSNERVDRTYIYLDIKNEYGLPILLDYKNAYILINGVKYEGIDSNNAHWGNSVGSTEDDAKEESLVFKYVPKNAYDMKIVVPVIYEASNIKLTKEERTRLFEFNVTFEN